MGAKSIAAVKRPRMTLASLAARVDALEAEVRALRDVTPAPPATAAALAAAILAAAADLDARQRLGGLVPIPELRRAVRARGVTADDGAVSEALLALERDFRIDLSVAQSPTAVAERALGIERPGRGLLYYVTRR